MLRTVARLPPAAVRAVRFPESQARPGPEVEPGAVGIRRISLRKGSTGALETLFPPELVPARALLRGKGGKGNLPGAADPLPALTGVRPRGRGVTPTVERGHREDRGVGEVEVPRGAREGGADLVVLGVLQGDLQVRFLGGEVLRGVGEG